MRWFSRLFSSPEIDGDDLRHLRDENAELKRELAEAWRHNVVLQEMLDDALEIDVYVPGY